jgi:putative methionine-R-sulfoxide reductase with GAF domain
MSSKAVAKKAPIKKKASVKKTVKKRTSPKSELYASLVLQLRSLLKGEYDFIANTANFSALVYNSLPDVNWAGFYFLNEEELVLGPFQGKPACVRIPFGKGVVVSLRSNARRLSFQRSRVSRSHRL